MSVGIVELVPGEPVRGSIRPPGSKSLTNRALLCAAFAKGPSTLLGALNSEDTTVMVDSLRKIGVNVETQDGGRTLRVDGSLTSRETSPIELFIGNSGTTVRFLTAALSALGGNYRLSGVPRMHQRPIGDLVDAIAGVIEGSIETESSEACPPVRIDSHGWNGNEIRVAGSVSSQYLSGLMMAAPIALQTTNRSSEALKIINIHVLGELVSRPYVEMTGSVMKSFGANVSVNDRRDANDQESVTVQIQSSGYQGLSYDIEPDASAASYFWAAAAITGGQVTVEGLTPDAMQGDVGFCEVLEQMGCKRVIENHGITIIGGELKGIDVDMNAISDTVQTLSVVALFASGPTRVRGVAHNRFKETDRIGDLAHELRKLGAEVEEHDDGMTIHPPTITDSFSGATIETYDDHRMAMSLSLAGLRIPGVRITNPACTGKTYPQFFADLERLISRSHLWSNQS